MASVLTVFRRYSLSRRTTRMGLLPSVGGATLPGELIEKVADDRDE